MKKKRYIKIAKEVIDLEIKALTKLKSNIKESFNLAVEQILRCQSKVILCGVGKSGLIASKIAATLASVGTPSFSLAASEASHGDLGMIAKKDILILHPGPINRGVEITSDLVESNNSIILEQVENGVAIRMAIMYLLASKLNFSINE